MRRAWLLAGGAMALAVIAGWAATAQSDAGAAQRLAQAREAAARLAQTLDRLEDERAIENL